MRAHAAALLKPLHLLLFLAVLNHAAFGGARIAVSLYALWLHASPLVVGVLISLFGLLPMFFSVTAGRLSDRVGARGPMLAGTATLVVGLLLPFVWPGLPALFMAAVLIGSGFVLFQVTVQNIVGFIGAPEDRPMNFSLLSLGFSVSGFLGPLVAGLAIDHIGHVFAFLLLFALPLAPLAVFAADRLALPPPPGLGPPKARHRLLDLFQDHNMRNVFIVTALLATAWDMFQFVMPIYGIRINLSATWIGIIMGSFSLATFVIRLALPMLARRFSSWRMLAGALFVAGATYTLFPLVENVPVLMLLAFVLGLGLGSSQPTVMSLLHNTAPAGRAGEAVGMRSTLINASQTTLPLLFGALGSALGLAPVFGVMAVCLVGGGFFAKRRIDVRS